MQEFIEQLKKYLYSSYRHKYIFIIVSLSVMTIIGAYSFTLPKMYKADTTVFVEKNVIDDLVKGIAITPNIEDKIRVLQYAILSRDLVTKTLEEINSNIFTQSMAKQQAYISDLINKKITVSTTRNMDRFSVSIIDKDPVFAQQFINTLVGKYVEENISSKRNETYGANRFLEEQIEIFKAKLEKAEDKIIAFRKKQGIYFSVDESQTLADIRNLTTEIENINLNLETLRAKKKQLTEQLAATKPTVAFVSETGEGDRLTAMQNRLNSLLLRYTENYPEVIRLKAEIDSLKKRLSAPEKSDSDRETTTMTSMNPLHQQIQGQIYDIDAELSSDNAKKKQLEQNVAKRENELQEVPAAKKELGILIQERDSYRTIYNDLLARMGQSEVTKQMEIGNKASTFRIVDPAVLPEVPVSPNMLKMFLFAIVGGLGSGIGIVFFLENLDNRVRDEKFLESLGLEVLAVVPNIADPEEIKREEEVIFCSLLVRDYI